MAKMYTNQSSGLVVVSGPVKSVSDDKKTFVVTIQEYDRDTKANVAKDVTLSAMTPVEDIAVGANVTATGFKAGGGKITLESINHENAYIESEGLSIISGNVVFASYSDEKNPDGTSRKTQAGTDKKPHYDITVAVGSGKDRVSHVVKIYNTTNKSTGVTNDLIGRYEKLFSHFDRKENPIYVTMISNQSNASTYQKQREYQGRTYQNQYMSHIGTVTGIDVIFVNAKQQEKEAPVAEEKKEAKAAAPVASPAPAAEVAPAPVENDGFNTSINYEDIDMDLEIAE